MFKKILIPTDASEASLKAVAVAKNIAENYSSEVVLLRVMEPQLTGKHLIENEVPENLLTETHIVDDEAPSVSGENKLRLFKMEREIFRGSKATIKMRLEHGVPIETIIDVADEEQVDLIVVGNRGMSGLSRLVFGSVSEHVVSDAHCPVLVVK